MNWVSCQPFAYEYPCALPLWANSADDKFMIFFLFFFPENRICHFMQIVSTGDNLHEMLNLFSEKIK